MMQTTSQERTSGFKAKYDPGTEVRSGEWLTLHRNENLFVNRQWMTEMARRLLDKAAITTYPGATCDELRAALAEEYGVQPENVFVGNGSDEVLADLLHLLRRNYERLSLLDVCFKIYLLLAERFDYQVDTLPGNTFTTGKIDVNGWQGLAVIDSPNAITSCAQKPEVFHELAAREGSFVIWDNAYGEFAGDCVPHDLPANLVLVRSFSKFYALAGLRVGYCIGDAALIEELLARKDAFNVNGFAQVMALEALRNKSMFADIRNQVIECRTTLASQLEALGLQVHRAAGNFVLARHPRYSGAWLQAELEKYRIAVRRFPGPLTEDYIRITVPPMHAVEKFIHTLADILRDAEARGG